MEFQDNEINEVSSLQPLTIKDVSIEIVTDLFNKYKGNQQMLNELVKYIHFELPTIIEDKHNKLIQQNEKQEQKQKQIDEQKELTEKINNEQIIFIKVFLLNNKFFYLNSNNEFYVYNNKVYKLIKEDDIIHKILTLLSSNIYLQKNKFKIKNNIIKIIKERNIFNTIPESYTIQYILNLLCPMIFKTKIQAKYFLTIIGDNILKKNQELCFLVPKNAIDFIKNMKNHAINILNNYHVLDNFYTKYNNTDISNYTNCRLLLINEVTYDNYNYWNIIMKQLCINIFCIATHYSNRYNSSDNYINSEIDTNNYYDNIVTDNTLTLKNYTFFLKNNNINNIIDTFISSYLDVIKIEQNNTDTLELFKNQEKLIHKSIYSLNWRDLQFIFKQYLSSNNIPYIGCFKNLKYYFDLKLNYDSEQLIYVNVTSRFLPIISNFIEFWNNNIIYTYMDDFVTEIEINDLYNLFKSNGVFKKLSNNKIHIIKIIKHYLNDNIKIIDNKYIVGIKYINCDNIKNIDIVLELYRTTYNDNNLYNKITMSKSIYQPLYNNTLDIIHFDDIYEYYTLYYSKLGKNIVNKYYFEKYLFFTLKDYITYDKFISTDWINC